MKHCIRKHKIRVGKMAQQIKNTLPSSLVTQIQSLEPSLWKERIDSHTLSSDLHAWAVACAGSHTYTQKQKLVRKKKQKTKRTREPWIWDSKLNGHCSYIPVGISLRIHSHHTLSKPETPLQISPASPSPSLQLLTAGQVLPTDKGMQFIKFTSSPK